MTDPTSIRFSDHLGTLINAVCRKKKISKNELIKTCVGTVIISKDFIKEVDDKFEKEKTNFIFREKAKEKKNENYRFFLFTNTVTQITRYSMMQIRMTGKVNMSFVTKQIRDALATYKDLPKEEQELLKEQKDLVEDLLDEKQFLIFLSGRLKNEKRLLVQKS